MGRGTAQEGYYFGRLVQNGIHVPTRPQAYPHDLLSRTAVSALPICPLADGKFGMSLQAGGRTKFALIRPWQKAFANN
mgnify:FL=1